MSADAKLRRARKYLERRGIGATLPNSKLVYRDSAGVKKDPPPWLKDEEPSPVIVLDDRRKA